ncbi:putative reverse transcriptase domain-containing protein [Tanacetum coccineum]
MLAQVSNRGNVGNQNSNVVNENVQKNVGNVIMNGNRVEMESVHDMSGCSIDQKVKYTDGSFVGKALTWWNSQIRTLSREVAYSEIEFRIELTPGKRGGSQKFLIVGHILNGGVIQGQLRALKFLRHVINGNGIHVDPSKIEAVKNWKALRTPTETLKDKLCNAPVLALPDGPEDFVVYCDASRIGLGCVGLLVGYVALKVLRGHYHRRWIELFSDYDCEIRYHPGKANVSSIKDRILMAQKEAIDEFVGLQKGLDEMIEHRSNGTLYYLDRIWVPLKGEVRTLIMDEAHKLKYSVHPGADKMYYDLRDRYWWPGMKKDIAKYVSYKMERFARLYLDEIVTRHGVPILIISDRDSRFILLVLAVWQRRLGTQFRYEYGLSPQIGMVRTCAYIQTWKTMLLERVVLDLREVGCLSSSCCVLRYNNSYHSSVRCAPFEALYEGQLIGPELVQETSEKISQIKDRLRDARDCQKSCGKLGKIELRVRISYHNAEDFSGSANEAPLRPNPSLSTNLRVFFNMSTIALLAEENRTYRIAVHRFTTQAKCFLYLEIEVVCAEFGCHFEVELKCLLGDVIDEDDCDDDD